MTNLSTSTVRLANPSAKMYHLNKWDNLSDVQKLEVISEIIKKEGRNPEIASLAVHILKSKNIVPRDYRGQAAALLKWVQDNIYYVNEPGERLQSPLYTLKRGYGDCDDEVILLCSLFESIGLPWKLVLSGNLNGKKVRHVQGDEPKSGVEYAHIYAAVGNQPFHPTNWFFAEPTIRNVPLGWDVVSSNSNELPELLNPRYSGYGASPSPIGVGVGVSAGDAYREQRMHNDYHGNETDWNMKIKEIAVTVLIGVATAVGTELALEYIRTRKEIRKLAATA